MLQKYIDQFDVLSVVGMCKNAGKTTVVNKVIESLFGTYKLAITSIGIDGETVDLVTDTHKPEIYVPKGTLVATAKSTLEECDITYKVLKVFDFTTPLGKIVLVEALSDGFVKIAGPSYNSQLEVIVSEFKKYQAQKIIVDGAASRKQLGKTSVCDALILATGASYNANLDKVVDDTRIQAEVLDIPYSSGIDIAKEVLSESKLGFIYKDSSYRLFDVSLGFESIETILTELDDDVSHIVIGGALTDTTLSKFISNLKKIKGIEIVVKNPVNVIASPKVIQKFRDTKMKLTTVEKSTLLFVSCNPVSAYGYHFDASELTNELRKVINKDIINVIGG